MSRHAVVRVYIHVEDEDAPGYLVDGESEPEVVDADTEIAGQFRHRIAQVAYRQARLLADRLYDPADPVYGTKEARDGAG